MTMTPDSLITYLLAEASRAQLEADHGDSRSAHDAELRERARLLREAAARLAPASRVPDPETLPVLGDGWLPLADLQGWSLWSALAHEGVTVDHRGRLTVETWHHEGRPLLERVSSPTVHGGRWRYSVRQWGVTRG